MTNMARGSAPRNRLVSGKRVQLATVALNLLLLLLIAHQLARLTWSVTAPKDGRAMEARGQPATTPTDRESSTTIASRIAARHPFGAPTTTPIPTHQPLEVPPTRLNLTLRGLLASDRPAQARAIIAAGGSERLYAIGDELPGQAMISEIHRDEVILERNGRLETLRLPKERGTAPPTQPDNTTPNGAAQTIDQRGNQAMGAIVSEYRERLGSDLVTLGQRIQVAPVTDNGTFRGFRINRIDGRERKLHQLGLRRGDLITAINGITLDTPYRGMEVLQSLGTSSEVSVELMRNGTVQRYLFKAE